MFHGYLNRAASATATEHVDAIAKASSLIIWRAAADGTPLHTRAVPLETPGSENEPASESWINGLHPQDREDVRRIWRRALRSASPFEASYRLIQDDGSYRWSKGHGTPLWNADGSVREWIGTITDIHDWVKAEHAATLSEDRLRLALESTGLGIWDCDVQARCVWLSETAASIIGAPSARYITSEQGWSFIYPDDVPVLRNLSEKALKNPKRRGDARFRIVRADTGALVWVVCSAQFEFDQQGNPVRLLGTLGDITEERRRKETLFRLAHYDHLTGLPNRRRLAQRSEEIFSAGRGAAFFAIDIDGFREANDRLGHEHGDELLRMAARRLHQVLPADAIIGRVGGDEFAVLAPGLTSVEAAGRLAERLHGAFAEPLSIAERSIHVSASMGIAITGEPPRCTNGLMVEADLALNAAKTRAPAATYFYADELRKELNERQQLIDDLQVAIAENQFELYYQPQVRLSDEAIVGAEALLRWRHPVRGLMMPRDFLDVLANSKWARTVGDWVIDTAIADAARLVELGHPTRIAVNLFSAQFQSGKLEDIVRARLAKHGLAPELLEIEITENVILSNDDRTVDSLAAIRAIGCSLAFDDYGTGYASLSMLKRFPMTRLKIDRSFVNRICDDEADGAIVDAILSLGRTFRLSVTAEGVETPEQLEWLKDRGCEEAQGFHFGGPVPLVDFEYRIRQRAGMR
ncbi:bifunctional diguanylate cyclase/phosphodiesterase [Afifella sp. IM 167]|uniref:putative bifunctional diguanylate cyclase/phosphodiesterase n=1 Tax=Afifella sp. IM 167 TaxID=2033586 RepID=UPI001CCCD637|nr:GGDEF domain-containing phosphodiesterase [Afifella sp. IM 167]